MGKESSSRRSGRRSKSDSDSDEDSRDSSPRRKSRKKRSSSSSRRRHSSSESEGSDFDHRKRHRRKSSRNITEEEINEYMAKKAQRKALKVAKKLKSQTISGYSNDSNPFGDANLKEKQKLRRLKSEGKREQLRKRSMRKKWSGFSLELYFWAFWFSFPLPFFSLECQFSLAALLARERARAEFQDWERKEEEFHFDQSKFRSEIRLREGRTKPIDILTRYLNPSGDFDIETREPHVVFKGLTVKEMEELHDDIKMHLDLDRETQIHIEFWEALMVVCDWELAEAQKRNALDRARVRGEVPPSEVLDEERGLHSSIKSDVKSLLEGKMSSELESMRIQIEEQMKSGTTKVVEYWEAILKRLQIFKAKARLREIQINLLRDHVQHLEQHAKTKTISESDNDLEVLPETTVNDATPWNLPEAKVDEMVEESEEEPGSFSPELLHGEEDEEAIDPEEDRAALERKRAAVLEEQQRHIQEALKTKSVSSDVNNMEVKAMKAMGAMEEGDAIFGAVAEVNLESQVYRWHDKYRPRKPKYFNRVHTGYEWNKYNQTHYDHDNPPPKIVQGYKFNIFYPDLVDKTKAPVYTIEKDGSSGETCLIRFHAGPPYEDIAFKIVNKEWEYSHKKGFKCTFERGILHVYFNFKRYRYRR